MNDLGTHIPPVHPHYRGRNRSDCLCNGFGSSLTFAGQRYNVVVEASPSNSLIPVEDQNYWIRIIGADGCKYIEPGQDNELLGIVRYNAGSKRKPTTTGYEFDITCRDEPSPSLIPVNKEDVTAREHPANNSQFPLTVLRLPLWYC